MSRMTVAILGMSGLMISLVSAQSQSEMMVGEPLPDTQVPVVMDKGDGLHYGPLQVLPELDVSYFHDSNPTYTEHGAKAANGIRAEPMLDLILKGNCWNAYARGWVARDWYLGSSASVKSNTDQIASEHYGESAGFSYLTPQDTKFSLMESYEYFNGNGFAPVATPLGSYNGAFGDRATFIASAGLETRLSEKTGMNLGTSYNDLWYQNTGMFGRQDEGATLGFSRKLTEKSDALLDFGADEQTSDGSDGSSQSYNVLVGFGSKPTPKTSYRAEVGLMGYDFNDGSKTAYAPTYKISGVWAISDRLSAHASGAATYQPAESTTNNFTLVDSLVAGLSFRATSRLTTTLDAIVRQESYGKRDASGTKRLDKEVDLSGRASYQLFRYTSVFVGAEYGKNNSNEQGDSYNRLFLQTGLNLHF